MKKYSGVLDGFFETGSEGVVWVLDTQKRNDINDLIFIKPGDYLTVYNDKNSIVFKGEIDPDYKTGRRRYSKNSKYGQQCALGLWIHWIQKSWKPDDWAKLFVRHWIKKWEGVERLRAELVRKPKNNN